MLFYLLFLLISSVRGDELFQKDIGNQMVIGPADKGYRSVRLKCGSDSMLVELETADDFDGVIYTRGSFYDRKAPCFLDGSNTGKRNRRSFSMKLPLNQCRMKRDGEIYSNVLVLQHDKDLIMPGDAAFNLECDFNNSRDIVVKSKLQQSEKSVVSRITLTDADPSVKHFVRNKRNTLENHTDTGDFNERIPAATTFLKQNLNGNFIYNKLVKRENSILLCFIKYSIQPPFMN